MDYISKDKNCIHSARCTFCSRSFRIRNGYISDLNKHSNTAIHVKNEKQMRSQRMSKTSAGSLTGCSKPTTKDQILNAEIWQTLNMVDKNHSFSSVNGDSDRFKKNVPGLANCCKILTRRNEIQICSSIWSIWSFC